MNSIKYTIVSLFLHSSFFLLGMDYNNYNNQKIEITVGINQEPIAYHYQFDGKIKPYVPVRVTSNKTIHSITGQPISTHMSFYPCYLPLKMIQSSKDQDEPIESSVQIGTIFDIHGRTVMSAVGTLAPHNDFVPTTIENGAVCYYHQTRSRLHSVPVTIRLDSSFKELFSQQLKEFYDKPVLRSEPMCSEENGLKRAIEHDILEVHGKELYHGMRGLPNKRKTEDLLRDIENVGLGNVLKHREIGHKPKSRLKKIPQLIQQ